MKRWDKCIPGRGDRQSPRDEGRHGTFKELKSSVWWEYGGDETGGEGRGLITAGGVSQVANLILIPRTREMCRGGGSFRWKEHV